MPLLAQNVSSTTGNQLALEGTPVHVNATSGTSLVTPAFTTTKAALIAIVNTTNDGASGDTATITSITGGGLTWARRKSNATNLIEYWTASAAAALSGVQFTINYAAAVSFTTADVFAISGNDTSTIYDSNPSVPASVDSTQHDPITVFTSNAFDFIFGGFRFPATANPTAGVGWTKISGADYQLVEYKIVSATQTSLSVNVGTGVGTATGGVADAVMSA